MIFIPKVLHLSQFIKNNDTDDVLVTRATSKLTSSEQKRLDELTKENLKIKTEIEMVGLVFPFRNTI